MDKNVLIIAFLPRATPRVEGLIRYISEFGWKPVVLTGGSGRSNDLPVKIVETPYRDSLGFLGRLFNTDRENDTGQQIRDRLGASSRNRIMGFLLNAGGAIINYPCPNKNWKPFAIEASEKLMKEQQIGAIISTSAPVTSHLIASEIKLKYGIPWVADFRDLWSQNHNYIYGPVRRMMDRRLEKRTIANADVLTTVSEPWAENLKKLHSGKNVYTILHGFNPAEVNDPPAKLTNKFTITYTGAIYQGKQDPSRLFVALRELVSDSLVNRDDVEVRFYGPVETWLAGQIEEYGLSDIVRQYGQVPRNTAVEKQRESQVLLFLNWDDPKEKGVYSGKIFEYMGARRPILSTGGSKGNVVDGLLEETGAGMIAVETKDVRNNLLELYKEYSGKGSISFSGIDSVINTYTHRGMAGKFSAILDNLTSG